jgi:hypothetical protein
MRTWLIFWELIWSDVHTAQKENNFTALGYRNWTRCFNDGCGWICWRVLVHGNFQRDLFTSPDWETLQEKQLICVYVYKRHSNLSDPGIPVQRSYWSIWGITRFRPSRLHWFSCYFYFQKLFNIHYYWTMYLTIDQLFYLATYLFTNLLNPYLITNHSTYPPTQPSHPLYLPTYLSINLPPPT